MKVYALTWDCLRPFPKGYFRIARCERCRTRLRIDPAPTARDHFPNWPCVEKFHVEQK